MTATGPGTTMGRIAALEEAVARLAAEVGELRERLDAKPLPEPKRDPASTTSSETQRAWALTRRVPASAFGFGPPEATG